MLLLTFNIKISHLKENTSFSPSRFIIHIELKLLKSAFILKITTNFKNFYTNIKSDIIFVFLFKFYLIIYQRKNYLVSLEIIQM